MSSLMSDDLKRQSCLDDLVYFRYCCCFSNIPANSEVGKNVTNAAATKGKDTSSPASASSPPPPQEPSGPGSFWKGRKSNKVDEESVQKGVIDVDAEV